MNLHVDSYEYRGAGGSGEPLLLIHGWAMHGGMWRGVAERLAEHFHVLAVDLPGHGRSAAMEDTDLDDVVGALSAQFSGPLNVWSLGGQVALRWAMLHPLQVRRLILVASTPCFARREDWSHAMSMELLLEFGVALQQHYALTLKRFLALQMRGGEQERGLLAEMRDTLFSCGEPDLDALQAGLDILRNCDLRSALPLIMQPALIVAGERDALVSMEASLYMAQQMPSAELVRIQGAAHAPFLSHPDEFVRVMIDFVRG
jgi:pimeloyl-[acyl-carrier protein] methyl ester esterase